MPRGKEALMEKTAVIRGKKYRLTFEDDFDGAALDSSKWELCPESRRQDAGGWWKDSEVMLENGCLLLRVRLFRVPHDVPEDDGLLGRVLDDVRSGR